MKTPLLVAIFILQLLCCTILKAQVDSITSTRPTCKLPDEAAPPPSDTVAQTPDTTVFVFCDELPHFPGGDTAWREYVKATMVYPESAKQRGEQGTVYVQFFVEIDGSITYPLVRKHPNSQALADEALRIVRSSPNWVPGRFNGKTVRTQMMVPIRFKLDP